MIYYKSLYERDAFKQNDVFKQSLDVKKLGTENRLGCEGKLTRRECFKSPGYDGLTAEFYKCFWSEIQSLVVNSLN